MASSPGNETWHRRLTQKSNRCQTRWNMYGPPNARHGCDISKRMAQWMFTQCKKNWSVDAVLKKKWGGERQCFSLWHKSICPERKAGGLWGEAEYDEVEGFNLQAAVTVSVMLLTRGIIFVCIHFLLEKSRPNRVSDTQERNLIWFCGWIYSHAAPHSGAVILLVVFDGNITSKIKHKGFSFHSLTQQSYTVFVFISVLFAQLSLLHGSNAKFSIVSLRSLAAFMESSKLLSKWIILVFEVPPLKHHAAILPFCLLFFCAARLILSGLIWGQGRRGETVWRWGDANNVAPYLMCLKCLWPLRLVLWSATNLMLPQVQGDMRQTDRRKKHCHTGGWEGTLRSLKRPKQQNKESI